ncbi:MAG TPA: IS5/IS1182 family transposase, partial [Negativicutes bacterium]
RLLTLIPLLKKMNQYLGDQIYTNIVADAGYETKRTTFILEGNKQTSYIKPSNYERFKTKKYRNNQYLRENMGYDEAADE